MIFEYIILSVLILFPYNAFGQDAGAMVLCALGAGYIILKRKSLVFPKEKVAIGICTFLLLAIPSFFITVNPAKALEGFSLYLCIIVYYVVFSNLKMDKLKISGFIYNISVIVLSLSVVYQGIYKSERVGGNFSYQNAYGIFLLFVLYLGDTLHYANTDNLNKKKIKQNAWLWKQLIVMTGIIFTGSRLTFVLLIIYCVLKVIFDLNRKTLAPVLVCMALLVYGLKYISPILPVAAILIVWIIEKLILQSKRKLVGLSKSKTIYTAYLLIPLTLIAFFIIPSNMRSRILNISLSTGVVQERILIFSDALKHILKNPLGTGINSFEYSQYAGQTAFYDVRYVHNSILQVAYDVGIPSAVCFAGLITFLFINMLKADKLRWEKVFIFLAIIVHSLWDFDFAFATIIILLVWLGIPNKENIGSKRTGNLAVVLLSLPILVFNFYALFCNLTMYLGDICISKGSYDSARSWYGMVASVSLKNPDVYYVLAQSYYSEGYDTEAFDNNLLVKCESNLKTAEKLNPADPRITANLAFVNKNIGNTSEAIRYFKKSIELQKYNMELYTGFYEYLMEMFTETGDEYYNRELDNLKNLFKKNYNSMNPRAKYMRDQLVLTNWNR